MGTVQLTQLWKRELEERDAGHPGRSWKEYSQPEEYVPKLPCIIIRAHTLSTSRCSSIPSFTDYCRRVRGRENQIKVAREKMAADEEAPPSKRKLAESKIQAVEEVGVSAHSVLESGTGMFTVCVHGA
jgi:hypothetical protein